MDEAMCVCNFSYPSSLVDVNDHTDMKFITQDIDRKASDLVRLALFHEQRRIPLRRDEISKKGTPML